MKIVVYEESNKDKNFKFILTVKDMDELIGIECGKIQNFCNKTLFSDFNYIISIDCVECGKFLIDLFHDYIDLIHHYDRMAEKNHYCPNCEYLIKTPSKYK